ncbi:MAG: hypothetical protein WD002_11985 [Pseudomonadales bacterium]
MKIKQYLVIFTVGWLVWLNIFVGSDANAARKVYGVSHEFDCLIEPEMTMRIGSPAQGILEEIPVRRGDTVAKGDMVARLQSDHSCPINAREDGLNHLLADKMAFAQTIESEGEISVGLS